MCQNFFGVFQPFRHFMIAAFKRCLQRIATFFSFFVHISHHFIFRTENYFRFVCKVHLKNKMNLYFNIIMRLPEQFYCLNGTLWHVLFSSIFSHILTIKVLATNQKIMQYLIDFSNFHLSAQNCLLHFPIKTL